MSTQRQLQPIRWAKGRIVATRSIFRKKEEKAPPSAGGEAILDFVGSLAAATASAAAAATAGAAQAVADAGPTPTAQQ